MNAAAALALEKKRLIAEQQAAIDAENEKIRLEEDAAQAILDAENNKNKAEEDAKRQVKKDAIQKKKDEGTWMSKKDLVKKRAMEAKRAELIAAGVIKAEDLEGEDDGKAKKASHVHKNKKNKNYKNK